VRNTLRPPLIVFAGSDVGEDVTSPATANYLASAEHAIDYRTVEPPSVQIRAAGTPAGVEHALSHVLRHRVVRHAAWSWLQTTCVLAVHDLGTTISASTVGDGYSASTDSASQASSAAAFSDFTSRN
jgi:Tfp pilus assembly protein PilX